MKLYYCVFLVLALWLFISVPLHSQNYLNIRYLDGSDKNVPFESLQKITFDETLGNLNIRLTDATTQAVAFTAIQRMTSGDVAAGTLLPVELVAFNDMESPGTNELKQNFPNPFNPQTTIAYKISREGYVTIRVYDVLGKEVASLVNEHKNKGTYEVTFDGSRLASGMYFCKMNTAAYSNMTKMIIMK